MFWKTALGPEQVGGFTASSIGMYFLAVHMLQMAMQPGLVVTWELWQDISRGQLAVWIVHPLNYPVYVLSQKLADFVVRLGIGVLLLQLPAAFLSHGGLSVRIVLGCVSSLLGFAVLFGVHFVIGTLTVFLGNVLTLRDNILSFTMLLGGGLLPLAMLPGFVQVLAGCTPMPSIYYTPARIFSDPTIAWESVVAMVRTQLLWAGLLSVVALTLWASAMRRYTPQGG